MLVGGLWAAWYFRLLPKLGKHGTTLEGKLDEAWDNVKNSNMLSKMKRNKVRIYEANVKDESKK